MGTLTVEKVRELFPDGWTVEEESDGIAVCRIEHVYGDRLDGIALLMQAAVRLGIDASQIRDETTYEEGTYWSTLTGKDSDEIRYRVVFLFSPV